MYDLILTNAKIIDGTGKPAYRGDVAVQNGKLVCRPVSDQARLRIDAKGLYLSPGFIDAHAHGDMILGTDVGRLCKVSQGVTTELTGQCGSTLYPVSADPEKRRMLAKSSGTVADKISKALDTFADLSDFLSYTKGLRLTNNFKILTGHNALRIAVMGFDKRKPTKDELVEMQRILRRCMEQGSAGLSSGLIYSPSGFAEEDELVELCKVVAEFDGIYATHMRNEASDVVRSVEDSIRVAEKAGCRLNISHHKICGRENWGLSEQTLRLVDAAVERGVRVTLDAYPYTASMSNLNVCLPQSFFGNGPEKMRELLKDPQVRTALIPEIQEMDGRYRHCGGFENILLADTPNTPGCCGMTVEDYAAKMGKTPFDVFFDVLCENGHAALAIYFSMCDEDLARIVADPNTVIGSDSMPRNLVKNSHPRAFGSFPRAIRLFTKEQKLMSLEQIVHKMTGLTAERLLVPNKGIIRDGYDADLVLFDYDQLTDRADYTNWSALSDGIETVIVNGQIVYQDNRLTGATPGSFIPHPQKA